MRQACYDCSASTSGRCWQHPTLYVRATEGLYEVEGAVAAGPKAGDLVQSGSIPPAARVAASSCSHSIWVWQRQCRECGIAEGPFEDVDRRPLI